MKKLLLLVSILLSLGAYDVKECTICNEAKHESNQQLLKRVLDRELALIAEKSPETQAQILTSKIKQIAAELLIHGFSFDIYELSECPSYCSLPLWEGTSIPLTFFVYVWPTEEEMEKNNISNTKYKTPIHSHSISCAFAILEGTFIQNTYKQISSDRIIQLLDTQIFKIGEECIDDLSEEFIHQLYAESSPSKTGISLHAYGMPSVKEVRASFEENSVEPYKLAPFKENQ